MTGFLAGVAFVLSILAMLLGLMAWLRDKLQDADLKHLHREMAEARGAINRLLTEDDE